MAQEQMAAPVRLRIGDRAVITKQLSRDIAPRGFRTGQKGRVVRYDSAPVHPYGVLSRGKLGFFMRDELRKRK